MMNAIKLISVIIIGLTMFVHPMKAELKHKMVTHYEELAGFLINDILADKYGNIWIATVNGLVKYDGYEYKYYHPDRSDDRTLGELLIYALFEDAEGDIWIGCEETIYRFNQQTKRFKEYSYRNLVDFETIARTGVSKITSGAKRRVYFGIASPTGSDCTNGLVYYSPEDDKMKRVELNSTIILNNVYNLETDHFGNIYGTSQDGLFQIHRDNTVSPVSQEITDKLGDSFALDMAFSANNNLWIITHDGSLWEFNSKGELMLKRSIHEIFEKDLFDYFGTRLIFDAKGGLWIGCNKGLLKFNTKEAAFETFEESQTPIGLNDEIRAFSIDFSGNLWIGTNVMGFSKYYDRKLLKSITFGKYGINKVRSNWIFNIIENTKGEVLFSNNHGVVVLDPLSGTVVKEKTSQEIAKVNNFINFIGLIEPDLMLVGTEKGEMIINLVSLTAIPVGDLFIPDSTFVVSLYTDSRGWLWYSTVRGLYSKNKATGKINFYDISKIENNEITGNEVDLVVESKVHNGLWLLSNEGLYFYNFTSEKISRHAYDQSKGDVLSGPDINACYEDEKGILWLGLWKNGLNRYNPITKSVVHYDLKDGLPSNSIQGILADEENKTLWLSTFNGISRFDIETEQFHNFLITDGIQGLLFADNSQLKSSGNYFFFGGSNGVTFFNPNEISQVASPPKVYITDFVVEDSIINIHPYHKQNKANEIYSFNHSNNTMSFKYTGVQHDHSNKNRFRYILENYDDTWRSVGNIRTVLYYNLPPGTYTFKVQAANSSGAWSKEFASLDFTIKTPWYKTKIAYLLYLILLVTIIWRVDRVQRRRIKRKQERVARQKELANARVIEKAYKELKSTQAQLIQAEKMASLGELTAGIAHEIQNPLNFVNNFSEVNNELIDEIEEERAKKQESRDEKLVDEILSDIKQNMEKINHHGKRADAIVKGMLQHSRTTVGQKEPIDINKLADEYVRLAYHGACAKDKSFNADLKMELDKKLPKINGFPQDIGRVFLNLINNAFYAVDKRAKKEIHGYQPTVSVSTKSIDSTIQITVNDNGGGIPKNIQDKIFQPFFTTKPTGSGTGLGLSMSYDIIKAHGGELKVETKEGEGAAFSIQLPIQ